MKTSPTSLHLEPQATDIYHKAFKMSWSILFIILIIATFMVPGIKTKWVLENTIMILEILVLALAFIFATHIVSFAVMLVKNTRTLKTIELTPYILADCFFLFFISISLAYCPGLYDRVAAIIL